MAGGSRIEDRGSRIEDRNDARIEDRGSKRREDRGSKRREDRGSRIEDRTSSSARSSIPDSLFSIFLRSSILDPRSSILDFFAILDPRFSISHLPSARRTESAPDERERIPFWALASSHILIHQERNNPWIYRGFVMLPENRGHLTHAGIVFAGRVSLNHEYMLVKDRSWVAVRVGRPVRQYPVVKSQWTVNSGQWTARPN